MKFRSINRRRFISYSALSYPALALYGCKTTSNEGSAVKETAQQAPKRVRYSMFSQDGESMLKVYEDIVKVMKSRDEVNAPADIISTYLQSFSLSDEDYTKIKDWTGWAAQAVIHERSCPHGNWYFLPWHRAYMFAFEEICRDVAAGIPKGERLHQGDEMDFYYKNFAIPYWDWTAQKPLPAIFFQANSPLNMNDDPVLNSIGGSPRRITETTIIAETQSRTFGSESINSMLDVADFMAFCSSPAAGIRDRASGGQGVIEASPHNSGHGMVGGIMGSFLSPYDPIFWTHHCNVDRLWSVWIEKRLAANEVANILPAAGTAEYSQADDNRRATFEFDTSNFLSGPYLTEPLRTEPLKGFYKPDGDLYGSGGITGITIADTINLHRTHLIDYDTTQDSQLDVIAKYRNSFSEPVKSKTQAFVLTEQKPVGIGQREFTVSFSNLTEDPGLKLALNQILALSPRKTSISILAEELIAPFAVEPGIEGMTANKNRQIQLVFSIQLPGSSSFIEFGRYGFFGEGHGHHGHHGVNTAFPVGDLFRRLSTSLQRAGKSTIKLTVQNWDGNKTSVPEGSFSSLRFKLQTRNWG
ncbi:MAG: tyrosinase family protein [Pseudobacteriovorax sp.]|nr:tyrosinase family protein [Pseudobacteriovorax sp.]